jgi:hypothetical protein
MPSPGLIAVFALATFVLTVTPGPGVLYVVGRAVGSGRMSGFASMLGIETGEAVYIAGAALGITALLATSAIALSVLRYAGAAYLVVLGIKAWRDGDRDAEPEGSDGAARARHLGAYGRGLVVQLLNPKVAIFFLAARRAASRASRRDLSRDRRCHRCVLRIVGVLARRTAGEVSAGAPRSREDQRADIFRARGGRRADRRSRRGHARGELGRAGPALPGRRPIGYGRVGAW